MAGRSLRLSMVGALLGLAFSSASCSLFEGLAYAASAALHTVATLPGKDSTIDGHHDVKEVEAVLLTLHERYPERTTLEVLGRSFEGSMILAMRVAGDVSDPGYDDPDVLFVGGTHGCEPAATETVLRLVAFVLASYDELGDIVANRNIWFVPLLNPDGLRFFHAGGPLWWRKNRAPIPGARWRSTGVDLNRNFPLAWGYAGGGSSPNPDSVMFRGRTPLSERESRAIHDLVVRRDIRFSMSFHTFGNQFLYPYSYDRIDPAPIDFYLAFCEAAAEMNGYRHGNPKRGLIPVHGRLPNGDFDDWMQSEVAMPDSSLFKNASLSMTVEVSPSLVATYFQVPDVNLFFLETVVPSLCAIEIADDPYGDLAGMVDRMDRIDARVAEILDRRPGGKRWVQNMFLPGGWIAARTGFWAQRAVELRGQVEEIAARGAAGESGK